MIFIAEGLKEGELVSVWTSPFKEKGNKKHDEYEYRVGRRENGGIELMSSDGSYSVIYNKELVDNWCGEIKRVKVYSS